MMVQEYSNIEIEQMTQDEVLKKYLEFKVAIDRLEMQMSWMKIRMEKILDEKHSTKFIDPVHGEFSIVASTRNQFQQSVAKGFLTEEQIKECYVPKEIRFIKVLSAQAKANQVF